MRNYFYGIGARHLRFAALPAALLGFALLTAGSRTDSTSKSNPPLPVFSATIPTDIANPADPAQAAQFAWQEFIAVTWPAMTNSDPTSSGYFRGQASTTAVSGGTGANGVTVWETFYHRDELYPGYSAGSGNTLPDANATPSYLYAATITPATPQTSLTLFNNADEASEINIANMYHTPFAAAADALAAATPNPTPAQAQAILAAQTKAAIVYEAKGNPVYFNYLNSTGFNNGIPRRQARAQAVNKIMNRPTTAPVFELPTGSIEIKATWRRYDATLDDISKFHSATLIYYTTSTGGALIANNDTFLLISLHIIQKTPNVPTFTFATFEHVDNEKTGFRFTNAKPQTYTPAGFNRALPDPGVIQAQRQFQIPGAESAFDLVSYNTAVQAQLRQMFGADLVWANYQLIGVQAGVQNDPGGTVPPQQFFLSNFATETNDTLQFFQGALGGTDSNVPVPHFPRVFKYDGTKYVGYTAGGCLGCHGNAGQFVGSDFSVIAGVTGNNFTPEPILPYPTGQTIMPQNSTGFPLPHQSAGPARPSVKTKAKGGR
ncbi:MAG: hypothetical protein V4574_19070 [Pseudomonadota bacterium]